MGQQRRLGNQKSLFLMSAILLSPLYSSKIHSQEALAISPKRPVVQVFFTDTENGSPSNAPFICSRKIHAYATMANELIEHQTVEVAWIRPDGIVQESTRVSVGELGQPEARLHFWIAFEPAGNSFFDDFHFGLRSSCGNSLDGLWRFSMRAGSDVLREEEFKVVCL